MEAMADVLSKVAAQMGTTTEMLWGVLIKQAPISGTLNIVLWVGLLAVVVWGWRANKKFTTAGGCFDDLELPGFMLAVCWFICLIVFFVTLVCFAELTWAAFFSPEYWALHKILTAIK